MIEYLVVKNVTSDEIVGTLRRDGTVSGSAGWLKTVLRDGKDYRDWDVFAPQLNQWSNGYVLVVGIKGADS